MACNASSRPTQGHDSDGRSTFIAHHGVSRLTALTQAIDVNLPPRERFRAADAGAVALTVYDFVLASRFQPQIVVFRG